MPFGLSGAPATFQRVMSSILSEFNWKACLIYLDDILVFACPAETDVIANNEVLLTHKNESDVNDLSIVFGNLTEISAELRYPEMYTKGNL